MSYWQRWPAGTGWSCGSPCEGWQVCLHQWIPPEVCLTQASVKLTRIGDAITTPRSWGWNVPALTAEQGTQALSWEADLWMTALCQGGTRSRSSRLQLQGLLRKGKQPLPVPTCTTILILFFFLNFFFSLFPCTGGIWIFKCSQDAGTTALGAAAPTGRTLSFQSSSLPNTHT